MKRLLLIVVLQVMLLHVYSQEKEKEPHYPYLSFGTCVLTNTIGSMKEKVFLTTEVGKTFGIFDIGLMVGRLNLAKGDSLFFTEIVPTINVFSKRRFSEALTLGIGHIYGAKQNLLTELTNSINYAPTNRIVLTVYQGNYFFDGRFATSKAQFMGLSITYNFINKGSETAVLKRKSVLN